MSLRRVKENNVENKKKTKKRRNSTVDQQRYKRVLKNGSLLEDPRSQDLALHSVIGHHDLQPFTWIEIAGDSSTSFFDNGQYGFDSLSFSEASGPIDKREDLIFRRGLIEVILKNEKKKRPIVELSILEDQYKKRDNPKSRLNRLKIGTKFYVYFGYRAAYTKWGPFRVDFSNIEFAEGTATLKVIGAMANRASRITTSEVYSLSEKSSAIRTLSAVCGININDSALSPEEIKEVEQHELVTANTDAVEILYGDLGDELGIDVFHFPENGDEVRLSTPYSLDLIKRGVRPNRITYGFPTSNAAAIQVKRKTPKYKNRGSGTKSSIKNREGKRNSKNQKLNLVLGYKLNEKGGYEPVGNIDTKEFQIDHKIDTLDKEGVKQRIQKLRSSYPEGIYLLKEDKAFTSFAAKSFNTSIEGRRYLFVYQIINKTSQNKLEIKVGWTEDNGFAIANPDYALVLNAYGAYEEEKKKYRGQESKKPDIIRDEKGNIVTIKAYFFEIKEEKKQLKVGSNSSNISNTHIKSSQRQRVYDQQEIKILKASFDYHVNRGHLSYNKELNSVEVKELLGGYSSVSGQESRLGDVNTKIYKDSKSFFSKMRSKFTSLGSGRNFPKLEITGSTSSDDYITLKFYTTGKSEQSSPQEESQPVNGDSTPTTNPKSKKVKISREQRKSTLISAGYKELTIIMKSGDYTHRVGNIIQLVDLHSLYDGYYTISSVTHRVSQDGFQTELQARVASSKSNKSVKKKKINNVTPKEDTPEVKKESGEDAKKKAEAQNRKEIAEYKASRRTILNKIFDYVSNSSQRKALNNANKVMGGF